MMANPQTHSIKRICPDCGCGELECHTAWIGCACCGNQSFVNGSWSDFASGSLLCPECENSANGSGCSGHIFPDGSSAVGSWQEIYPSETWYRGTHSVFEVYWVWPFLDYALAESSDDKFTDQCGNIYERGD